MKSFRTIILGAFLGTISLGLSQDLVDLLPLKNIPSFKVIYESSEAFEIEFSNLSRENKEKYNSLLFEASNLTLKKRIFAALEKLSEAETILPQGPYAGNLFGACYIEFRDFKKAEKYFGTVYQLAPNNISVNFNLAEMSYVSKDWENTLIRFNRIIELLKEQPGPLLHISRFKKVAALLKLNRIDEAKKIQALYTENDDNPFYYYAKALFLYHADDHAEAAKAVKAGRKIYNIGDPPMNAVWEDSLIELGYLGSFLEASKLSEEEE